MLALALFHSRAIPYLRATLRAVDCVIALFRRWIENLILVENERSKHQPAEE
jgi:hypothetical protein